MKYRPPPFQIDRVVSAIAGSIIITTMVRSVRPAGAGFALECALLFLALHILDIVAWLLPEPKK